MVVTLEEALDIDAVVVVGYGVQKKSQPFGRRRHGQDG